jgi:hypothetical protein
MKFCPPPVVKNNCFVWKSVRVGNSSKKGLGLFATKKLDWGDCIPYGGTKLSNEKAKNLVLNSNRKNSDGVINTNANYLVTVIDSENGFNEIVFDGHPRKYSETATDLPTYGWIGSYCNEPNKGERANATLIHIPESELSETPSYPTIAADCSVFIHIEETVEIGDEILVLYGWDASRYRSLGYLPGYDVDEFPVSNSYDNTKVDGLVRSRKQIKHSMANIQKINCK